MPISGSAIPRAFKRWMVFVDGENWTIRGQAVAEAAGVDLSAGRFHQADVFLWPPGLAARKALLLGLPHQGVGDLEPLALRAYFYTTVVGDTDLLLSTRERIRRVGFEPRVFKKDEKARRTKGVDISMAVDALGHAYGDHYDVAVLLAGDSDYLPLVEAIKRLGKFVWVGFYDSEATREMQLVPDYYTDMTEWLLHQWRIADSAEIKDP